MPKSKATFGIFVPKVQENKVFWIYLNFSKMESAAMSVDVSLRSKKRISVYSLDMTILVRKEGKKALIFYYWFFQVDQGITFYMPGHAIWWSKIRQIAYCVPMKVFRQKVFIWCICTQNIILKLMPCFVFLVEFQHQFSNTFHVIKSNVFR